MSTSERWRIFFDSSLDPRWIAALGGVLVLLWVLGLLRARAVSPRRRFVLAALRALALAAALAALAEPALLRERVAVERGHVAVLLDRSASMELPIRAAGDEERRETRRDTLARWLEARSSWWSSLAERFDVDLYAFGEEPRPARAFSEALGGPPQRATDLGGALKAIGERYEPGGLAAALVLSDGADTGSLGELFAATGDVKSAARALGAPIVALGVGDPETIRDYAIVSVGHEDFGFVRTTMTVRAVIDVSGYAPARVPVTLTMGDERVAVTNALLDPGRNEVELQFVPEHAGQFVFTVEVPVYAKEISAENNAFSFVTRVIRDRVRVLHVVGRPSWDERFLRRFLKENPNVDLISFFILRTPEDMSSTPQNELSLIPFPTDELFTRELKGFDLIILQNFNYRPYVRREYLDNVARYVSDGGALVMIGGDLSFGAGGYADTEIEDVLPVRIWGAESPFILGEFAASLTPSGAHHPIMRLDPRDGANRAEWNALPTLLGVNRVHDVRSGATVLAWGPPDGRGGRAPLIVAGEAGRGRVMAVTTDTTWRWSFLNAERQGTGDAYHRFWDNAIRWLVKDPEFGRVRITPRRARFDPGAPIEAGVDVLNVEYAPAPEAPLDLRIEDARKGGALLETRAMTDESGHFDVTWTPPGVGFYRIVAVSGPERAEAIVEAEGEASSLLERRRTTLGHDLLAALARESGGAFATVRRDRDFIRADIPPGGRVHVLGRDLVPLWSSGWMIALFVGLAGADWALRKRWGLP